jgi:hypothetical protein
VRRETLRDPNISSPRVMTRMDRYLVTGG